MMGSKILGPEDDPLAECRKRVLKKSVGRARRAVQEWDRRHGNGDSPAIRHPHEQYPSGQHASRQNGSGPHAGWTAAIRDDTSSQDDPSTKSSFTKRDSSAGESPELSEEASTTDSQPYREPLPDPLETRERAVEEKISIYLRLIDRDTHSGLYRRASSFIDENYSKIGGVRRRVLIHEAVGRIFLEKEGAESLPDPLSDQLE